MISLVSTVLNDCDGTRGFFAAMANQKKKPDEIVIVDGGSNDGTWESLLAEQENPTTGVPLVARQEKGCNVARGRGLAIEASMGDTIVSTDIGCEWDPEWFEEQVAPLQAEEIDVVIGSWAVRLEDAKSDWARVEFARRYPFRLEAAPDSLGINRAIAYRRHVWQKVGGYPQDLSLAADDVVFDMIIRQPRWGFQFAAASVVRCYWERHEHLAQFAKEERRNFFGAAEAGIWMKHFILVSGRLIVEFVAVIGGMIFLLLPDWRWPGLALLSIAGVSLIGRIRTMTPAIRRLRELGVARPLWRLLIFEYSTKIRGMQGYWRGIWNGRCQCRKTRERLKA